MKNSDQIPDYYQTVMPYLILKDVLAFLKFAQKVFGAEIKMKHMNEDGRIVHTEIAIGNSTSWRAKVTKTGAPNLPVYM